MGRAHISLSVSEARIVMFVCTGWARQRPRHGRFQLWRPAPSGGGGRCRGRLALERALWRVDLLMQPRVLSLVVQGKALPQAAAFGGWMTIKI